MVNVTEKQLPEQYRLFGNHEFRLLFGPKDSSGTGFTGAFYEVAAACAPTVVKYVKEHNGLFETMNRKANNNYLSFQGVKLETEKLLDNQLLVSPEDIELAREVFYRGYPAQAWLLVAVNLASEGLLKIPYSIIEESILSREKSEIK